ncbi:MAG: hypothetical protein CXT73_05285 [Methanobacteriota archaeon]|nr:MAG: hypothetical protein CXT73_05285 [Euryarchaeota archaeon]
MSETINIKIIFQSIIEIICTILGLDKINNKKIEFTTSSNAQNINNIDKFSVYDLCNHSMKSYNDFMGIEGLTNVKNNEKSNNEKSNNEKSNNEKSNNEKSNQYIKEDMKKKATMPVWAKTTK